MSVESAAVVVLGYAPGIIAKATVILTLAGGIAALAKRASAARRHLLWLCALLSCAALVILSPLSRPIVLPVPSFIPAKVAATLATRHMRAPSMDRVPGEADRPATLVLADDKRSEAPMAAVHSFTPEATAEWPIRGLGPAGLMLWLGGFLFVTLRFAVAYGAIVALVHRSRVIDEPEWGASLTRLTRRSDITLRISADVSSPFTIGLLRPTIVLSADAAAWSNDRRDAVLCHEIAHIERGDIVTQTLGLFSCSLLWFHPLAWFGLRRLRYESESAADDRVIVRGASPAAYAAELVQIARGASLNTSRLAPAVGIGTPPLEKRIRALLDRSRSRRAVSSSSRVLGVSVALAAMFPFGGLELARAGASSIRPTPTHGRRPSSAHPVDPPAQRPSTPVAMISVQRSLIPRAPVAPPVSVDSVDTVATKTEQAARIGLHPDFSGIWASSLQPSPDSGVSPASPRIGIAQTPQSITWTIDRRATDEFGRTVGVVRATLDLVDGAAAQAAFTVNGRPARLGLFAMSWDSDTVMIRTAQLGRHGISGAVERFWLTADGRGMVTHSAPFGYIVNDEVTDTLWRRR